MKKTYNSKQNDSPHVAEPAISYNVKNNISKSGRKTSSNENSLEDTMSVDEYFDELISLVHSDYANL